MSGVFPAVVVTLPLQPAAASTTAIAHVVSAVPNKPDLGLYCRADNPLQ
jgi:hypothetical protein